MLDIFQNIDFTILAIFSAVFGALANVLVRVMMKKMLPINVLGISFVIVAIGMAIFSPLFFRFEFSTISVLMLLSIGLIDGLGNYFYFKAFRKTEASVATPLLSLAPVFTFLFGWLFLSDVVDFKTFVFCIGIVVLLFLFSIDFKNLRKFHVDTVVPTVISALLFGLSAIPSKYLLDTLSAVNAPTLYMLRAWIVGLFLIIVFRKSFGKISRGYYGIVVFHILIAITQWMFLYTALKLGNSGVAITLANTVPIFTFIFGIIFLREKPTLKKFIAAGLVVVLILYL